MAKLTRITGKVFGSNATATVGGIGQFGSAITGTPNLTTDVATIQALPAYLNGWGSAVVTSRNFPPIEEVTGVLKTISYQACYNLQEGIPEYDINTEYSNTSLVKSVNNGIVTIYASLQNNNIGNSLSNGAYWKPYILDRIQRNIGEIVQSAIPLTDAGLHLLDGSLLSGSGSYGAFVTYIAGLYTADPTADYFTTEANWQSTVTQYGVCGKFVYDSVNNTVRLPKYNSKIYTGGGTASVKGNGMTLGLQTVSTGSNTLGGLQNYNGGTLVASTQQYGKAVGSAYDANQGHFFSSSYNGSIGVTSDGSNSGIIADLANITTSLDGYYYIVIATSTKTSIQVDIDEIATDLNGKADVDLTNVNNTGTTRGASWAMPSTTYDSLTLGASGATYQAPANGWFVAYGVGTGSSAFYITNDSTLYRDHKNGGLNNGISVVSPALKGETVELGWFNVNISYFIFIYAKGSESEAS